MENNQPLFDIFEYLGINITEDLETVQRAIDDLPAAKMAELRKKPEFSSMRKFLYTKKATNEFLSYVQNIRDLKDPAKQERLRQEQLRRQQELERQQQEQLRQQQERQRQEQIRQQQERQRQEQIRQQQERQRQEQIRQQQERQRQEQLRQQQLQQQQYQQQQYRQQQYRQPQYQQPRYQPQQQYRQPQPQYQPRTNTQQSSSSQSRVRNSNQQTNPAAAILAFIGAVLYGIWWCIKNAFISICAFFGFGDAPATVQLATPTITSIVEHDDYVVVSWGPVFCADYYELHDEEVDYDFKIDSGLTKTITRPDYGNKEYTLTAHSNKSKYSTSDKARITVRPKYLGSPPDDNYFYY